MTLRLQLFNALARVSTTTHLAQLDVPTIYICQGNNAKLST